jgi:hypothetical protein
MSYLHKSAKDFDDGDPTEAARLAVTLRVLLWNKGSSEALLNQLGVQHQLKFLDTRARPVSGAALQLDSGLGTIRLGDDGAVYVASLDAREDVYGPQPFRVWWNRRVLRDLTDSWFTRKELVLFLAHKLGGAHVDTSLQPRFHALTKLNSQGWGWRHEDEHIVLSVPAGPDDEPLGSPIPVNVRQIAHEVERTVNEQCERLLNNV